MNKKILLLAVALVLPVSVAYADPMEGKTWHRGHHGNHLASKLGLNADQQAKVEEIFKEEHEKFQALHEESHNRIKAVLTPEQEVKWEKMVSEHREMRRAHHHKEMGAAPAPAVAPVPVPAPAPAPATAPN